MKPIEIWYEFASTYSYPAVMRAERLAGEAGVRLVWRPFLLGPIFQVQGWNDSPFNIYPAKGRHMWRDLERICEEEGLVLRTPVKFPQASLKAARIAMVGAQQDWIAEFSRRVYLANFADQKDISDEALLSAILSSLGLDAVEIVAQSAAPANKERLKVQTEEAMARGIFGAPSFLVGDELFWGNDRLENAIRWAAAH